MTDNSQTAALMGTVDPPSPFSLPARSTRGKRLAELVGDELEEDEEFWSNDKWNDEEDDDDFDEGASGDEEYAAALDDADSDFDKPEEEDEAIIQEEDIVRLQKEEKKKEQQKRGAYVDPALKQRKEAKNKKKGSSGSIRSAAQKASEIVEGKNKKARGRSRSGEEGLQLPLPTIQLRDSTRNVTAQMEAKHERERELAEKRRQQQQQQRKTQAEKPPMTQDERLAEAVATEEANKRLLEQMLAVFEEKKQSQQFVRKKTVIGVGVTYVSKTITGKDGKPHTSNTLSFPDEFPAVITQKVPEARKRRKEDAHAKAPQTVTYDVEDPTLKHYMEEISIALDEKRRKIDGLIKRK